MDKDRLFSLMAPTAGSSTRNWMAFHKTTALKFLIISNRRSPGNIK
jgi:hypothetical protein